MNLKKPIVQGPAYENALRQNNRLYGEDSFLGRHFKCIVITGMVVGTMSIVVCSTVALYRKYG